MPAATEVSVPDLGDFTDVPVIEIHVAAGDVVGEEDPLITLESDKATMDIPSPAAGTVRELRVEIGDRVEKGSLILLLDTDSALTQPPPLTDQQEPPDQEAPDPVAAAQEPARRSAAAVPPPATQTSAPVTAVEPGPPADFDGVHAGPGVRRLARELGVDLTAMSGSGPKGRITKDDLLAGVRGPVATTTGAQGGGHPGDPGAGLLEVRPGGDPAAVAHSAAVRPAAAPVVAQHPARHPQRRGGHHRPRRLPQGTRHCCQNRGLPGDVACLPH